MKRFTVGLAATMLTAALANAQQIELEKVTVRDTMVPHQDAVTFLKPRGWVVKGGVQWYHNLAHLTCLEMTVSKPDGLEQIETFPWSYCTWQTNSVFPMQTGSNYLGMIVLRPIEDPVEVVRSITLPTLKGRRNARIVSSQPMPQVAKEMSQLVGGASTRAARVRLEYAVNGEMVEEDIYLSIYVTSANLGVNNCVSYIWGPATTPFSLRAKKGELDAKTPLMLSSVNSARIGKQWFGDYMYVKALFDNRQWQGIADARRLSEYLRKNSDEISRIYSDSYWSRQKTYDRVNQNFSDYIRGVQRYTNPYDNTQYQLPSGYSHVWTSQSGYYILTNDANYDPNTNSNQSWQSMRPAN